MIVTIPFTLPSTWLIDKLGIRSGVGFKEYFFNVFV
jgi:hypothetical protein